MCHEGRERERDGSGSVSSIIAEALMKTSGFLAEQSPVQAENDTAAPHGVTEEQISFQLIILLDMCGVSSVSGVSGVSGVTRANKWYYLMTVETSYTLWKCVLLMM